MAMLVYRSVGVAEQNTHIQPAFTARASTYRLHRSALDHDLIHSSIRMDGLHVMEKGNMKWTIHEHQSSCHHKCKQLNPCSNKNPSKNVATVLLPTEIPGGKPSRLGFKDARLVNSKHSRLSISPRTSRRVWCQTKKTFFLLVETQ